MMAKTTISIALMMGLTLVALPAAAEHGKRDRREAKVEKVAYKLAEATTELYAEARHSRHRSRSYRRALWSLSELDRRACAFSERVRHDGVYSYKAQRDFERLAHAYQTAQHRVDRLHDSGRLHAELEQVNQLMARLDTKLARVDRRGDAPRHHARIDTRRDGWHAIFAWNF
jgi:hypothetical protein